MRPEAAQSEQPYGKDADGTLSPLVPCPFCDAKNQHLSNLFEISRVRLRHYVEHAWSLRAAIFSALDDSRIEHGEPLASRLGFALAHPAALMLRLLRDTGLIAAVEEPFDTLFAEQRSASLISPWSPKLGEIRRFRERTLARVLELLETLPLRFDTDHESALWTLLLAVEYDRAELESALALFRELSLRCLVPPPGWVPAGDSSNRLRNDFLQVPAGIVTLGKRRSFPSFGRDTDYGAKTVIVEPFDATRTLVTTSEFVEFVRAGGYRRVELWSRDGWRWRSETNRALPAYWSEHGDSFRLRTVFDERDLPRSWPVEVSYYEAEAFCRFRGEGCRLPSEAEWNRLTMDHDTGERYLSENDLSARRWNICFRSCSPCPVDADPPTTLGFHGAYGNVWQWAREPFRLLPTFRRSAVLSFVPDSAAGTLLGGSFASTGATASKFTRGWSAPQDSFARSFRVTRKAGH